MVKICRMEIFIKLYLFIPFLHCTRWLSARRAISEINLNCGNIEVVARNVKYFLNGWRTALVFVHTAHVYNVCLYIMGRYCSHNQRATVRAAQLEPTHVYCKSLCVSSRYYLSRDDYVSILLLTHIY